MVRGEKLIFNIYMWNFTLDHDSIVVDIVFVASDHTFAWIADMELSRPHKNVHWLLATFLIRLGQA